MVGIGLTKVERVVLNALPNGIAAMPPDICAFGDCCPIGPSRTGIFQEKPIHFRCLTRTKNSEIFPGFRSWRGSWFKKFNKESLDIRGRFCRGEAIFLVTLHEISCSTTSEQDWTLVDSNKRRTQEDPKND